MTIVFIIMSYGGMALAVICLALAVVLFIKWNIPKVFGDITGHTERKAIERIRNEGYEANRSKSSAFRQAAGSGKIRVRRSDTSRLLEGEQGHRAENGILSVTGGTDQESAVTKEDIRTAPIEEEETTLLSSTAIEEEETTLLAAYTGDRDEDGVVQESEKSTTILTDNRIAGVILIPDETITQPGTVIKVLDFVMVHTDQNIA